MDAIAERIYRNPSVKMSPATSFNDTGSRELKRGRKRIKTGPGTGHSASWRFDSEQKRNHANSRLLDNSDPFSVNDLLSELDSGKYGSATEEIMELIELKRKLMGSFYAVDPGLSSPECLVSQNRAVALNSTEAASGVIDLDDDQDVDDSLALTLFVPKVDESLDKQVVIIESDDENDDKSENFRFHYQEVILPKPCTYQELSLNKPSEPFLMKDYLESNLKKESTSKKSSKNIVMKDSVKMNSKKISSNQESNSEKISSNRESKSEKIPSNQESKSEKIPSNQESKSEKISSNQESNSKKPSKILPAKDYVVMGPNIAQEKNSVRSHSPRQADTHIADGTEYTRNKGEYVGTDDENESDDVSDTNSDGLGDIWNEMMTAELECPKDAANDPSPDDEDEECEHSFIFKEDIGDVCRICGVINREISTIIEYNFSKAARSTRTYRHEERTTRDIDPTDNLPVGISSSSIDYSAEIYPHPRHSKEMKPHQIEGFNFLISNLMTENPGGCILAHAPGSGKTFMIISFLQSFMAKHPAARPLVVLPRGILGIWKKEFVRWQVENIPLYDCYSAKADSRAQQLEVLKEWVRERSILFLGYKQFSSIVCDTDNGSVAALCQNYLLTIPSILILDEGHTPRNQDTDVLTSLERVETPRKVVLSGTLYQNHVKEVFNILNLVRPKFLKMETSKAIRRRILSKAEISSRRNLMKHGRDNEFYELIEHTLIKDENHTRKVTVIQDLREMTRKVLHYYKGDNLDELPGLVDFSVYLRLSHQQKSDLENLIRTLCRKFTITAQGSAIYVHPSLKFLAKNTGVKDRVDEGKIDEMLEKINVRDGVKLNFYLNLLELCESTDEKILVFSQYLLPLKFLERITAKVKGYTMGKEMFMITGDSDNETREFALKNFNESSDARVFFGSIRACGEGISLVGASRIIILDIHLNPSVTRQAIGRAFRPGQVRKVYTYRLISADSPEEEDHDTCFKKESIAKMWFEWDECRGATKFDMETVDVNACGDSFLESPRLKEDVVAVKKR